MDKTYTERIKVMIADDHPIVCSGLKSIIDNTNDMRVVATANDTEEALEKALHKELDILVLDLVLPGAGGMEVLKTLRNKRLDLKVLVLSLQNEKVYKKLVLDAGASDFLNKATSPKIIIETIRDIVRGGKTLDSMPAESDLVENLITKLTSRELEIARLLVGGKRNCDIARLLDISDRTVHTHRTNIYKKTQVSNLVELIELSKSIDLFVN